MQLRGKSVKRARLSEDLQSCSDSLSKYLCEIIFLLMGGIYSINCIQLVLREAFFSGGQLNFVLLELCPSSELLTDLSAWSWLLSSLLTCIAPLDSAWTVTSPLRVVSVMGLPWLHPAPPTHVPEDLHPLIDLSLGEFPGRWETLNHQHCLVPVRQTRADVTLVQAPADCFGFWRRLS